MLTPVMQNFLTGMDIEAEYSSPFYAELGIKTIHRQASNYSNTPNKP